MTKLEALLSYTLQQRRDTWVALGSAVFDSYSKVFTQGTVFQVNVAGVALDNAILYVDESFTDETFDWSVWSVSDLEKGTIKDANSIIHPYVYILLTGPQVSDLSAVPVDPAFIPFDDIDLDEPVIISERDLNLILTNTGVPFINLEELEYNRNQILELMVLPAVLEYFKWHPIIDVQSFPVRPARFEIPIPSTAFTAERAYLLPGYPSTSKGGNPLSFYFNEMYYAMNSTGTFTIPTHGPRKRHGFADTDALSTRILDRAVRKGAANIASRTRIRVEHVGKKIVGYSTAAGMLEVEWASFSNKWEYIPFNRQSEVRELATSYALRNLAMLRSQARTDIPGTLDYQGFLDRANQLEEKIITLWQSTTKPVIIRST